MAQRGVEGLTHRAVASAADVPLGSTTYYYATLDDLLSSAMRIAVQETKQRLAQWSAGLRPDADLVAALGAYIVELTGTNREALIVQYELYMAALRRPALGEVSRAWDGALSETLADHTDSESADVLALVAQALMLHSVTSGTALSSDDVEPALRRAMR